MKNLELKTREEIRVMTDPYRLDIMQVFRKNDSKPLTVNDIAKAMGEPHGKVYYHIKKLEKIGALELHHIEKINGINAKYYVLLDFKITMRKEDDVDLSDTDRNIIGMIEKLFDDSKKQCMDYLYHLEKTKELDTKFTQYDSHFENDNLYFTNESFKAFSEEIRELFDKYKNKDENNSEQYRKAYFLAVYGEKE